MYVKLVPIAYHFLQISSYVAVLFAGRRYHFKANQGTAMGNEVNLSDPW